MPDVSKLSADELLGFYLNAPDEEACAKFLEILIEEYAVPLIKNALTAKSFEVGRNGFYLSKEDFEDLCSESRVNLVIKLDSLRLDSNGQSIRDFNSYVRSVAENSFNQFLGSGTPHRKSLKNKIRYVLGKSFEIDVWKAGEELYCGLLVSKRRSGKVSIEDLTNRIKEEFADFRNMDLCDLVSKILKSANSKVLVNDLVSIVARLWTIEDYRDVSLEAVQDYIFSEKPKLNELEMRAELERHWQEISALPVNQRIALLYNLRDEHGREMLLMFFNLRIASLREISAAMNLSFDDCACVLPLLPMDDKTIAEKMKLTTKQVSNLRKVARENLRRRLAGKPKRENRGSTSEEEGKE